VDRRSEISAIGIRARETFEEKHRAREVTIAASRQAIQACAASIRATHRGEYEAAETLAREARDHLAKADAALAGHGDVRNSGPLHDAKKELAEAWCTLALVRDDPLPTPEEIAIDAAPYCNGLAEAASELRRQLLDRLRAGDLARAEELMSAMDEIYSLLVTIDYPDGVTSGLRRTTDALRAVLERTRGDLTTAVVAFRLQAAIESREGPQPGS
jgi:translin